MVIQEFERHKSNAGYYKESTKNIRGMRKHAQGRTGGLKRLPPFWMMFQHTLDSLNFNRIAFHKLCTIKKGKVNYDKTRTKRAGKVVSRSSVRPAIFL